MTSGPRIIGVAGYMGAGKSSVVRILSERGFTRVDADVEAKKLMNADKTMQHKLVEKFGPDTVKNNLVDFRALGDRVFRSQRDLAALNAIVHPPLLRHLQDLLETARKHGGVVLDAALLPLWGRQDLFDTLIWVWAPRWLRVRRLERRTGLSPVKVRRRMKLQEKLMLPPPSPPWRWIANIGSEQDLVRALDQAL